MDPDEQNQGDAALTRRYLDEHGRFREGEGRPEPPDANDEIATLLGFLERQRATLAWKCGGLDAAALRATVGASTMTLGGMLKHLARFEDDMATEWLQGLPQRAPWNAIDWETDRDWDWRSAAAETPAQLYARWQDGVARSRSLFAAAATAAGRAGRERAGAGDGIAPPSLRYILVNMIEEYARHNGHADLIRESIDGLVGQDPPG